MTLPVFLRNLVTSRRLVIFKFSLRHENEAKCKLRVMAFQHRISQPWEFGNDLLIWVIKPLNKNSIFQIVAPYSLYCGDDRYTFRHYRITSNDRRRSSSFKEVVHRYFESWSRCVLQFAGKDWTVAWEGNKCYKSARNDRTQIRKTTLTNESNIRIYRAHILPQMFTHLKVQMSHS